MGKFKDSSYLLRLAALFAVGLIAFIAIRAAVIPKSFGQYGPYRGKALTEITARPLSYAGHEVCEGCHSENIAKPASFPQVNAQEHSSRQPCNTCHKPHSPRFYGGDKK